MFLKLKHDSSGYTSWMRVRLTRTNISGIPKLRENWFREGVYFHKCRAKNFGENKFELDVGKIVLKPEQDMDIPYDLIERDRNL